ncbi:hypothetical protein ACW95P_02010 [Candidatus Mycoplasma pogonae]
MHKHTYKSTINRWSLVASVVILVVSLVLFLSLYLTHNQIAARNFALALFISFLILLLVITTWFQFLQRKLKFQFEVNPHLAEIKVKYHKLIDRYYTNVLYDYQALIGAYTREIIRYGLPILIGLVINLIFVLVAVV